MRTKYFNLDDELRALIDTYKNEYFDKNTLMALLQDKGIGHNLDEDNSLEELVEVMLESGSFGRKPWADGYVPTGKQYGIKINKSDSNPSTRMEYILDAKGMSPAKMNFTTGLFEYGSWADVWFVKNNYPCMVGFDGEEKYKLNPKDYSKKLDGAASDIKNSNYQGNVMARIPLVYLKQYEDATHEYIIVSDVKHDDTWNAFAHTREDGTIAEQIYISSYKCTLISGKLRSLSGFSLANNNDVAFETSAIKANGTRHYHRTWAQRNLINSLLFIIGRDDNTQTVFGQGNSSSSVELVSGTSDTKGQFFGYSHKTGQVKVFHIEEWWGNKTERIQGILTDYGVLKVKMTPPFNQTGVGYTDTGIRSTGILAGVITKTKVNQYGRLLTEMDSNGSTLTYLCDMGYHYNTGLFPPQVGGYMGIVDYCGASFITFSNPFSYYHTTLGAGMSII